MRRETVSCRRAPENHFLVSNLGSQNDDRLAVKATVAPCLQDIAKLDPLDRWWHDAFRDDRVRKSVERPGGHRYLKVHASDPGLGQRLHVRRPSRRQSGSASADQRSEGSKSIAVACQVDDGVD